MYTDRYAGGILGGAWRALTANVLHQTLREREQNPFLHPCQLPDFRTRQFPDAVDHPLNQYFGGRSAGGHADTLLALQPGRVDLFRPINQVAIDAARYGDFLEPPRVRAVRATDDDDQVALLGQRLDGILAILRGVADIVLLRPLNFGKPLLERGDDNRGIIDPKRGLGDERECLRRADTKILTLRGFPRCTCRPGSAPSSLRLPGAPCGRS